MAGCCARSVLARQHVKTSVIVRRANGFADTMLQARGQRLAQHTFPQLKTKGGRRTSEDAEDVSGRSCRPSLGLPLSSSARGVRGRDGASRLSLSRSSSASAGDSTHNLHHPAVSPSMLGGLAHDAAGASAPEARRTLFAGDPEAERGTSLPWGDDAAV